MRLKSGWTTSGWARMNTAAIPTSAGAPASHQRLPRRPASQSVPATAIDTSTASTASDVSRSVSQPPQPCSLSP